MLSKKKQRFVELYLATGNESKSALEAGYKSKGYGKKLLQDEKVKNYILSYTANTKIATAEEVLAFLTAVMRGEEWEIKVNVKKETGEKLLSGEPPTITQRQKAAEMLAKRYRLFSEDLTEEKADRNFTVNIKVV